MHATAARSPLPLVVRLRSVARPAWLRGSTQAVVITAASMLALALLVASPGAWLRGEVATGEGLLETADLVATWIFALGAVWGMAGRIDAKTSVVTRILLASAIGLAVANGGGTTRDLIAYAAGAHEHLLPFWIRDPRYLAVSLLGAAMGWAMARRRAMGDSGWGDGAELVDFAGLGLFAVMGAGKVVPWVAGLGPWGSVIAIAAGMFSAAGGGIVRDVLIVGRPAFALRSTYGLAAAFGASVHVLGMAMGGAQGLTAILGALVAFGIAWRTRDVAWAVAEDRCAGARLRAVVGAVVGGGTPVVRGGTPVVCTEDGGPGLPITPAFAAA